MSRLMITSDLHLGHVNIHKFRDLCSTAEEHHEIIFDNFASSINKSDSVILLGDIAFDAYWLNRISEVNCRKKTLILGNHDTERLSIFDIVNSGAYDAIHSLFSKRNRLFSHCPIHADQFRGKVLNIHGHLHDDVVTRESDEKIQGCYYEIKDISYFNACVEHTDYKPISFSEILERTS